MLVLGEYMIGTNLPLGGRIRNLNIEQVGPISATASWDLEGNGLPYVYLNGYLAQAPAQNVASLSGMTEGSHNISVISLTEFQRQPGFYYDHQDGQRVRLRWPQADETVASYNVYGKHEAGSWELLDTIRERQVQELSLVFPQGNGSGKISVPGVGVDQEVNFTLTLEVTGEEEATYSYGVETGTTTISPGSVSYLPYGVQVYWHDPIEEYQIGDSWSIQVGVSTEWLSEELAPGVWDFAITAIDEAGNESAMLEMPGQVFVPDYPDPVEAPALSYDEGTETLELEVALPAGASEVRIFTNFDPQTQTYEDYIQEDVPLWESTYVIANLPPGLLKFYLWPVSASGAMLRDYTLYQTHLPLTLEEQGVILGEVENFTAVQVAGEGYRLTWNYNLRTGDSIHQFEIFSEPNDGTIVFDTPVAIATLEDATGAPYLFFDLTIADPLAIEVNSPLTIQIRASNQTGTYHTYSETLSLNIDSTAPAFGGTIEGGVA